MGGSGGGGLLGGATKTLFGDSGAGAANNAAIAQQQAAQTLYKKTDKITSAATNDSIASYARDISNQEKNLSRQEQLVSQIDPTIIEASQQALRLLRGESSSTLQPIQNQRNLQRQKLVNSLREQLGPGAETSTAGIQALTRFDSESNNLLAGQQQSALSGLGGLAGQFNSVRPDILREITGLSQFGQGGTNTQFQRAGLLQSAYAPVFQTAGANQTGAVLQGQQSAAFGQALLNAGVQGASSYYGAKAGAAPKPPAGATT